MILANSTWGKLMADLGVPGIYRSQASMAPGIKVRMGTKALPHAGIGVSCYAWSTSPLRRYTDLVNQWQICACAEHGATAALVAPFKPKDTDLLVIISSFDSTYSAYNAYQSSMERYWTLKYLEQENIQELNVSIFKSYPGTPPLARADTMPLVVSINGAPNIQRGAIARVRLSAIDLMTLDVKADFIELCQSEESTESLSDMQVEFEYDFEDTPIAPSAITFDLDVDAAHEDPAAFFKSHRDRGCGWISNILQATGGGMVQALSPDACQFFASGCAAYRHDRFVHGDLADRLWSCGCLFALPHAGVEGFQRPHH